MFPTLFDLLSVKMNKKVAKSSPPPSSHLLLVGRLHDSSGRTPPFPTFSPSHLSWVRMFKLPHLPLGSGGICPIRGPGGRLEGR